MSFRTLFDIPFGVLPVYVLRCERWLNGGWQRIISKPHPRPLSKGRGELKGAGNIAYSILKNTKPFVEPNCRLSLI